MSKLHLISTLIITLALTACGQKGALYLPEQNSSVVEPQVQPADDSTQPAVSDNPQNPNVNPTSPLPSNHIGNANDY
ncbi:MULTISPECIES: LPS translocon maturation chaperone LptM [unclassified Moraxella]|uniref:LPS translocon maturation chaperone LptM n=1 Tax=unclassified Moraxella TaxID=2685852 RepID=UPI003AF79901